MNMANGPPGQGRVFYVIQQREDGAADVYLMPFPGVTLVVRGVDPWDGEVAAPEGSTSLAEGQTADGSNRRLEALRRLEEDIRARYYAWCESAETAKIERGG